MGYLEVRMAINEITTRVASVKARHEAELLRKAHVVGVAVGRAQRNAVSTDQICLIVMVDRKVPLSELQPKDLIPRQLEGVCVDVQEVGTLRAH